jgi:hypothetical protein
MPPKNSSPNSLQLPELQTSCLYIKNTKNSKTTKIEDLPVGFGGKINKNTSCVIPKNNPTTKHLEILPTKIPRKGSKNHRKKK